ncbi:MAG: hypothetical protein COT14_03645 [Candidatus Diapherotrites archaeon CG08_land_8_20_14_0_20_30_16]|nr:MAG: hypothetical protein COT14_03645 [Candidatus Diapherotrites archaeon CG08_land_8_20_14_0_20_30_16]
MAWHVIPYISNRRHNFNVIKLIGTFLFFFGLVGFIVSFANLFHQWDVLSNIKTCFEKASDNIDATLCRDYFYQTTGIALSPDRYIADANVNVSVSFWPLVSVLWWIIVMLFSIFIYNVGSNWHGLLAHKPATITPPQKKTELPKYLEEPKPVKMKK